MVKYINQLKVLIYRFGDRIVKINDNVISNSKDLEKFIMFYEGHPIKITYIRDDITYEEQITPVLSKEDRSYHLGLWIKDGGVGIGTVSMYSQENDKYVALGHGITDVDTGKLLDINDGDIVKTDIVSISKGKTTTPGQIKGMLVDNQIYGNIKHNYNTGIYGYYTQKDVLEKYSQGIGVASIREVKQGEASIISAVDNEMKEYKVKITKVYKLGNKDNKNMIVEVIDNELLKKTGGIIQGMSGSPIIQNNKLVGVLTHVFVNDPTQGYGVFAETLMDTMNNVE